MIFKVFAVSSLLVWASTASTCDVQDRPNIIVMQPDDLNFFEPWTPPPHFPVARRRQPSVVPFPANGLPNMNRLRLNGVQMKEAYTASSMCGTSRFSTMTGRYPSRSAYGRSRNTLTVPRINIPNTKLVDIQGFSNDCSVNNLAALLSQNGYRTGVVGKWHLFPGSRQQSFDYRTFQNQVKSCGFDYAEALYAENLSGFTTDGTYSHNMEYVTAKGVDFITQESNEPFFLYFNPTVPHGSGDVLEALNSFPCTATPEGTLTSEPQVRGMTEGSSCFAYRQTVQARAGSSDNKQVGSVWIDDGIGSLLQALEDTNQLDNTFFLFQMDHGQEGKSTVYEPGLRLAQFIHFPSKIPARSQFSGIVSTVDIGPTILDYACIDENSPGYYQMDGTSWRFALENATVANFFENDRCLFFEMDQDRAVRCGCNKYIRINSLSSGNTARRGTTSGVAVASELLFDLCDASGNYDVVQNREVSGTNNPLAFAELSALLTCHNTRTGSGNFVDCGPSPPPPPEPTPPAPLFCFSGENTVHIQGKGPTPMKDLSIGDFVMVQPEKFERVYSFGHRHESAKVTFLQIQVSSSSSPLEISSQHLMQTSGGKMLPASSIQVGSKVETHSGLQTVTSIKEVTRNGLYAPFTPSGTIMVNGFIVSTFVSLSETNAGPATASWKVGFLSLDYHMASHLFEAPHRLVCHSLGWTCPNESYTTDGISHWHAMPLKWFQWLQSFQEEQNSLIMALFLVVPLLSVLLSVAVLEFVLVKALDSCWWTCVFSLLGLGAAIWSARRQQGKKQEA